MKLPGEPGPLNAITDVADVAVGLKTIIETRPRPGRSLPVRTGVTAIMPHASADQPSPVWAGFHRFNGNGEMTGTHWIADGGYFVGPVLITNTHAVGIAHHAAVKWLLQRYPAMYSGEEHLWIMPVVAETYDGLLNDINGQPITEQDVFDALADLKFGPVMEGNSGGGTGMVCYEFKGGTGTASRRVAAGGKDYTVGVLVQANHGIRRWLSILGIPVGRHLPEGRILGEKGERGSIIAVIATDAPLLPHQLSRLARRGAIGIGRNGTVGGNNSGDLFLAFSVGNCMPMPHRAPSHIQLEMINDELIDPIYEAAVQGIEEAIINALVAASDMGGSEWDRFTVRALDHNALGDVLRRYDGRAQ
ncbi:MAG TPA: P1 family peptidase [Dongiaceae bacterium]|nr:P1 family peptidase [Dongiaceae bacterium]